MTDLEKAHLRFRCLEEAVRFRASDEGKITAATVVGDAQIFFDFVFGYTEAKRD